MNKYDREMEIKRYHHYCQKLMEMEKVRKGMFLSHSSSWLHVQKHQLDDIDKIDKTIMGDCFNNTTVLDIKITGDLSSAKHCKRHESNHHCHSSSNHVDYVSVKTDKDNICINSGDDSSLSNGSEGSLVIDYDDGISVKAVGNGEHDE